MAQMAKDMGIFEKLEVKSFTASGLPSVNVNLVNYPFTISHSLGVVPDFVCFYPKQRVAPPSDSGGNEYRIIQFAIHANIGGRLYSNAYTDNGFDLFTRLYTNGSNSKYYQWGEQNPENAIINTLTSTSIQIGGKGATNTGLFNGDYWVMIGKIASKYQQGEQVIYSE